MAKLLLLHSDEKRVSKGLAKGEFAGINPVSNKRVLLPLKTPKEQTLQGAWATEEGHVLAAYLSQKGDSLDMYLVPQFVLFGEVYQGNCSHLHHAAAGKVLHLAIEHHGWKSEIFAKLMERINKSKATYLKKDYYSTARPGVVATLLRMGAQPTRVRSRVETPKKDRIRVENPSIRSVVQYISQRPEPENMPYIFYMQFKFRETHEGWNFAKYHGIGYLNIATGKEALAQFPLART